MKKSIFGKGGYCLMKNGLPEYATAFFNGIEYDRFVLSAGKTARDDSICAHQDTGIYTSKSGAGSTIDQHIARGRRVWIQVLQSELPI